MKKKTVKKRRPIIKLKAVLPSQAIKLEPMPKRSKISAETLAASRYNPKKVKQVVTTFDPALHPKSVMRGVQLPMAQDTDLTAPLAWAAQSVYNGAFQEGVTFLGYAYLAELSQRPEYRRIVEVIATEMTRKWIKLHAAGDEDKTDKLKKLEDAIDKFKVRDHFRSLAEGDGYFGRSHLFINIKGSLDSRAELKSPIGNGSNLMSQAKVTINSLERFTPVEAVWCYPSNYNASDPLKPDWYNPQMWIVQGTEMHASRLLTLVGRPVPDMLKPAYSFGGLSLTQMAKPYVDNWLRTRQSVSDLVSAFSVMILHTNMQNSLAPGNTEIFDRADLFANLRDNRAVMMVDKDSEDVTNVTTSLASLDLLQAQSQEQMSSVSGIPLVKLLGVSPHGLNASSDGEVRTFYDNIEAFQQKLFFDKLKTVIDFIQLNEFGFVDPTITFTFNSLWTLDEKGRAEVRKIEAETDSIYLGDGVINQLEVRKRVAAEEESPYASLDLNDLPLPPVDPSLMPGEEGVQGNGAPVVVPNAEGVDAPAPPAAVPGSLKLDKSTIKGGLTLKTNGAALA